MPNDNNDFMIDAEEDLGLNLNLGGTNLFEQFHKDKAEDKSTNFKPAETNDDDDSNSKKQPSAKSKNDDSDDSGKVNEVKFKVDNVLDMVKDHFVNGDDNNNNDADPNPKNKKPAGDTPPNKTGDDANNIDPATLGVFKTMYEHFTENHGYRPFKEGEFDGTPEAFDKWLDDEKEEIAAATAESMIEESFINNPRPENQGVAVDLFNFLKNGGAVADFIETRKHDTITPEFITAGANEDEKIERSKTVMNNYYTSQGWDKARIEKTIKNLEVGGALLSIAEETLPEFIKFKEKQKAIVDENNIREKTTNQENIKKYNSTLIGLIDTAPAIGPFEFKSKKEREQLKEYLFVPTVDAGNGNKVPQFIADRQKASQNPSYTLFQALMYMNKGIDLTNVKQAAADSAKKDIKSRLEGAVQNNKIERTAGSSADQNNQQRTNVSDLLDFDNLQSVDF